MRLQYSNNSNYITTNNTLVIIGLPCADCDCSPTGGVSGNTLTSDDCFSASDIYIRLYNEYANENNATKKDLLFLQLIDYIKVYGRSDRIIINEVAHNLSDGTINNAAPFKTDNSQIFLHNLHQGIKLSAGIRSFFTNEAADVSYVASELYDNYKYIIICNRAGTNDGTPAGVKTGADTTDGNLNLEACLIDCCYPTSQTQPRVEKTICVSNGEGIKLFTREECCCTAQLYQELALNTNLELDLSWRVFEMRLLCEKPADPKTLLNSATNKFDQTQYFVDSSGDVSTEAYNRISGTAGPTVEYKADWYWGATGSTQLVSQNDEFSALPESSGLTFDEGNLFDGDATTFWQTRVSDENGQRVIVNKSDMGLITMKTRDSYRYLLISQGSSNGECGFVKNSTNKLNLQIDNDKIEGIVLDDVVNGEGVVVATRSLGVEEVSNGVHLIDLYKVFESKDEGKGFAGTDCSYFFEGRPAGNCDCTQEDISAGGDCVDESGNTTPANEFKNVNVETSTTDATKYNVSFELNNKKPYTNKSKIHIIDKGNYDVLVQKWATGDLSFESEAQMWVDVIEAPFVIVNGRITIEDVTLNSTSTYYLLFDGGDIKNSFDFGNSYKFTTATTTSTASKKPVIVIRKKKSKKKSAPKKKSTKKKSLLFKKKM